MEQIRKWMLLVLLVCGASTYSRAQSFEVQQLLLNAEKLAQLKNILSDMKRGYQTLSSGYQLVKNISQGNFSLHDTFLNGLLLVSPEVRKYHRISDIIKLQSRMLKEYKTAFSRFRNAGTFSANEIGYLENVYGGLVKTSLGHLDELTMVITADKLRMSDDERLNSIDRIFEQMQDKVVFLRDFNQRTTLLLVQRKREKNDIEQVRSMHQ